MPSPSDPATHYDSETPQSKPQTPSAAETSVAESEAPVQSAADSELLEELPEWEEMTPELMEDECLRGDFVLRWAVVLLALLLGWTYITESQLLVQLRSGQAIVSNGGLPPRTDPFSSASGTQPWVNLGWLSDVLLSQVHQVFDEGGLTVLCAITITLAFLFLSRITLPQMTTWWASVCAALALVAVFPMFQPGHSSITLLMVAALLWIIHRAETREKPLSWGVPVLFVLWSNLDRWAWVGMLLLLLYGLGETFVKRAGGKKSWRNVAVIGVSVLAGILVHPWPGRPALGALQTLTAQREMAAYTQMKVEHDALLSGGAAPRTLYDGASEFFPQLLVAPINADFWRNLDVFSFSALVLLGASLLCLLLNLRRLHPGWVALWLGANALSVFLGPMVYYAALVNCVAALLWGQDWYRHNSKMEYRIDFWSVSISRAGRALTVLSFFMIGYLAVNGSLMGAGGRRIGFGLDPRLEQNLHSLQVSLMPEVYQDNIYPQTPNTGDFLIYLGKKPFIDGRLAFHGNRSENRLRTHRETNRSLFALAGQTEIDANQWKQLFEDTHTNSIVMPLWRAPTLSQEALLLYVHPSFTMTGLAAAGASFVRSDRPDAELHDFLNAHNMNDFVATAFRDAKPQKEIEIFPTSPNVYNRWLVQEIPVDPETALLSARYLGLAKAMESQFTFEQQAALLHLALRQARLAVSGRPNHPLAYRLMSNIYLDLSTLEQRMVQANIQVPLRQQQALAAARDAVLTSGADPLDLLQLHYQLVANQALDTALMALEQAVANAQGHYEIMDEPSDPIMQDLVKLQQQVGNVRRGIELARVENIPRKDLIIMAYQEDCPSLAIEIIEEDLTEVRQHVDLQLRYGTLLLEVGRIEEALDTLVAMSSFMNPGDLATGAMATNGASQVGYEPPPPLLQNAWRQATALARLSTFSTAPAETLWQETFDYVMRSVAESLIQQPFASGSVAPLHDIWAATTARLTFTGLEEISQQAAHLKLRQALAALEIGDLDKAREDLRTILEISPEFSMRSVVVFYLQMLTGEQFDIQPPSDWIPIDGDMFAPETRDEPADTSAGQPPSTETSPETELDANPKTINEESSPDEAASDEAAVPEEESATSGDGSTTGEAAGKGDSATGDSPAETTESENAESSEADSPTPTSDADQQNEGPAAAPGSGKL